MSVCVPGLIVNLVAKARSVDDGQRDASALLVELEFCSSVRLGKCEIINGAYFELLTNRDWLDLDAILDVGRAGIL